MAEIIQRGDEFTINGGKCNNRTFICVGVTDDRFFAGTNDGQMWMFVENGESYDMLIDQGPTYANIQSISSSDISKNNV